eukprot:15443517-Alexandrium_andersonii.AAC.1
MATLFACCAIAVEPSGAPEPAPAVPAAPATIQMFEGRWYRKEGDGPWVLAKQVPMVGPCKSKMRARSPDSRRPKLQSNTCAMQFVA